jgi:hypothetical protein
MRRWWKRVAKYADNRAFDANEITNAIGAALEQDCRGEMSPEFLSSLSRVCQDQDNSLFRDQARPALEALRAEAGPGIGRVALDYAIQLAASGKRAGEIPAEALKSALIDHAARCTWQLEEHCYRNSPHARAYRIRDRVHEGIKAAPMDSIARRVLHPNLRKSARQSLKKQGLDDGVSI